MLAGSRRVVALAFWAASLLPAVAYAEDAPVADSASTARQHYQRGSHAFQAKRYEEAALHFEAAASSRTNAVALYTAAMAWDLASRPERAADAYSRAIEVGGLDPKQNALAQERITQLEAMLGTVLVTAPEGWRVQLDTFTEVLTPARLHGAAGVRSLTIRPPGKSIERRDVTLEASKVVRLELKEPPKAVAAAAPEEATKRTVSLPPPLPPRLRETFWTTPRAIGVGVAGLGLAAVGSGILFGLEANSAKDAYNAGPTQASFDHAKSLQTWTNISLIAGGVLVAGGIALVVIPRKGEDSPRVGLSLGSVSMTGRF